MKTLSVTAVALSMVSGFALAGTSSLFGVPNDSTSGTYYVGAGMGKASDNRCNSGNTLVDDLNTVAGTNVANNLDCSEASAWKVYAGYRLSPTVSVEGAYLHLGERETGATLPGATATTNINPNPVTIKSKATGVSVTGVASAPLSDELSIFGKMGAVFWDNEDSITVKNASNTQVLKEAKVTSDGTDLTLGAGAEYKLDENWAVRGEYEHFNGLDANMYSIGATFSSL